MCQGDTYWPFGLTLQKVNFSGYKENYFNVADSHKNSFKIFQNNRMMQYSNFAVKQQI